MYNQVMKYRVLSWDQDVGWQYDAACLGVTARFGEDLFFRPENGEGKPVRVRRAKMLCASCKVRQECLRFALDNGCTGVWGGTTERERKRMRR